MMTVVDDVGICMNINIKEQKLAPISISDLKIEMECNLFVKVIQVVYVE